MVDRTSTAVPVVIGVETGVKSSYGHDIAFAIK